MIICSVTGQQHWTGTNRKGDENIPLQYNGITQNIGISAPTVDPVFFVASSKIIFILHVYIQISGNGITVKYVGISKCFFSVHQFNIGIYL